MFNIDLELFPKILMLSWISIIMTSLLIAFFRYLFPKINLMDHP